MSMSQEDNRQGLSVRQSCSRSCSRYYIGHSNTVVHATETSNKPLHKKGRSLGRFLERVSHYMCLCTCEQKDCSNHCPWAKDCLKGQGPWRRHEDCCRHCRHCRHHEDCCSATVERVLNPALDGPLSNAPNRRHRSHHEDCCRHCRHCRHHEDCCSAAVERVLNPRGRSQGQSVVLPFFSHHKTATQERNP